MEPPKYNNRANYTLQQRVQLIRGGKAYFDTLLQLINEAQHTIHLQTYIYQEDETGQAVAAALIAAARRKVAVYLLLDGYASQGLSTSFIEGLKAAGIQFRFFEPLFRSHQFYVGRRMHHKIMVADAQFALVGGINIADRYNDVEGIPAWLDFALYVAGPVAADLCVVCSKTWNGYAPKSTILPCDAPAGYNPFAEAKGIAVRMRRNDWVRRKNEVSNTYIEMFRYARSHIIIVCSYFLPGRVIRRLLSRAATRGVTIKVVTAGQSDIAVAKSAERWLYDWLLRNHIELYEYQPTVLHAKIAVCDGQWFTIGSYNVNNISAYASIEMNLDVRDADLAATTEQQLQQVIAQDCIKINQEGLRRTTNLFKQFGRWLSYQFIRGMFYLFTFYFKRRAVRHKE